MKRLLICGLFLFALTFVAFFYGQAQLFAYWALVIGVSILVGTCLGTAFGEMDMAEEKPVVRTRTPAPVTSRQF